MHRCRGDGPEAAVLAQLAKVASYDAGDQLVLKDASDASLLTYDAGLTGLEGTSWAATGVNNGKGGVASTTATETITAAFAADGKLSGFAGCNDYNGAYEVTGDDGITITGVAMAGKACADLHDPGGPVRTALDKATSYAISGKTLTLRDSVGRDAGHLHPRRVIKTSTRMVV